MNKTALTAFLFFFHCILVVNAQVFHNLDFSQSCDTSATKLCYWDLSWGNKANVTIDTIDHAQCLMIRGISMGDVGFTEQTSTILLLEDIAIVTLSATVRSENIEGKGAGINLNVYDAGGQLLAFKDMGGFYSVDWITGTTPWKEYSISLVCPIGTAKIAIGAILFGKGEAWYKNFKVVVTPVHHRKASKIAMEYIGAACDTIKKHSLIRDSFDIRKNKPEALRIAGDAKKYSDCYLAVSYLLESLREYGDYHSFFMKASEVENWKKTGSAVSKIQFATHKVIDSCGYINVPPFHGGNPQSMLAYADSLQSAIRQLEDAGIKGWLIDLRENTGGNMEPMLAGLGPLFSSDRLGSLVDVENNRNAWYYKGGRYFTDDDAGWSVSDPVALKSTLPIAVMTSTSVGSSGEIVVISFIGNARTKSFGQPTMGLTTGNGSFEMPDGSQLFLASTIMCDRNDQPYTGSILPDVQIDKMIDDKVDVGLQQAIAWIKAQH